jgi:O-antigen/teichoic acid export membrane protein
MASTIAFVFSLYFLATKMKYWYRPAINPDIVRKMAKFSLGNYAAAFVGGLPALSLPILITNSIGPHYSAYFYMDMMIANLLYIIPIAVSQSLFAEGSHNEQDLNMHLRKAVKIILFILIPSILAIVLFGNLILLAFGHQYSTEGFGFLQILALSGIFVAVNYVVGAIFKVRHKIKMIVFSNVIEAVAILGFSYLFISKGLLGIGIAWILGQAVTSVVYIGLLYFDKSISWPRK